jgi:hypothetical protein
MVLRGAYRFGLVLARGRGRRVLLLAGLVFAAVPAGSALADTTIGQTGFDLGVPCPNADAVIGDTNYVVPPGGGTITSFSFQSAPEHNAGQQLDFLVLRQAGGSNYTVVGESGIETLAGTGDVESFRASIAVKGGDILGVWVGAVGVTACFHHAATTGGAIQSRGFVVHPNVGATVSLPGGPETDLDLNESATLATGVGGAPPPTSKAQCKHGGWRNFGSSFKNQGQCVRFVNHHQKKHHHKHHPRGLPVRVRQP